MIRKAIRGLPVIGLLTFGMSSAGQDISSEKEMVRNVFYPTKGNDSLKGITIRMPHATLRQLYYAIRAQSGGKMRVVINRTVFLKA